MGCMIYWIHHLISNVSWCVTWELCKLYLSFCSPSCIYYILLFITGLVLLFHYQCTQEWFLVVIFSTCLYLFWFALHYCLLHVKRCMSRHIMILFCSLDTFYVLLLCMFGVVYLPAYDDKSLWVLVKYYFFSLSVCYKTVSQGNIVYCFIYYAGLPYIIILGMLKGACMTYHCFYSVFCGYIYVVIVCMFAFV